MAEVLELTLTPQYRAGHEIDDENPDRLLVWMEFDVKASSASPPGGSMLPATFVASYRLEDAKSYEDDSLSYFATINGTFNLWPYWRELVHTSFNRIGHRSVVLPLFRVQAKKLEDGEVAAPGDG